MKVKIDDRRRARIEMLPLIDIVFLLLVFFIYAMMSMAVHRGMNVALPESSTAGNEKNPKISVSVTADGSVYVDKASVSPESLTAVLKEKAAGDGQAGAMLLRTANCLIRRCFAFWTRFKWPVSQKSLFKPGRNTTRETPAFCSPCGGRNSRPVVCLGV